MYCNGFSKLNDLWCKYLDIYGVNISSFIIILFLFLEHAVLRGCGYIDNPLVRIPGTFLFLKLPKLSPTKIYHNQIIL